MTLKTSWQYDSTSLWMWKMMAIRKTNSFHIWGGYRTSFFFFWYIWQDIFILYFPFIFLTRSSDHHSSKSISNDWYSHCLYSSLIPGSICKNISVPPHGKGCPFSPPSSLSIRNLILLPGCMAHYQLLSIVIHSELPAVWSLDRLK